MSFVRLNKIRHTTGFRVAIAFLIVFIVSVLMLFTYIYWKTAHYMVEQLDKSLKVRVVDNLKLSPVELKATIDKYPIQDPALLDPLALFTPSGERLAGGLQKLPDNILFNEPYNFAIRRVDTFKKLTLRGILYKQAETDNIVIVASDIHGIHEFNELLVGAMFSSIALILLMGITGAIFIGINSQKQLDKMTVAIRKIIQGDLKERLPVDNKRNDINRLALILNQMLDEIERLMQHLKGACDDIAHDLRTPLTRLLAGLERMQRKERSKEEYSQAIDQAVEEAHSLLHTFKALLKISEVENNIQKSSFTAVDLKTIVDDAVEFYAPVAEEKEITLTVTTDNKPVIMQGDQYLLFDALSNLLDNALKFTPQQGKVTVSLQNSTSQIQLIVTDSGIGIPEVEREDVLRRFYRSERSRNTPGNGLGLSMVAAVAHMHNMQLTITDANPGCSFCLTYIKK